MLKLRYFAALNNVLGTGERTVIADKRANPKSAPYKNSSMDIVINHTQELGISINSGVSNGISKLHLFDATRRITTADLPVVPITSAQQFLKFEDVNHLINAAVVSHKKKNGSNAQPINDFKFSIKPFTLFC